MGLSISKATMLKSIALLATGLVSGACSQPPSFLVEPVLGPNPNPAVPLAALVEFEASAPVTALIDVTDGDHAWQLEYGPEHDPSAGLAVVGMRPDRRHEVRVSIRSGDGAPVSSPDVLEFRTPPLPEMGVDFPPIEVAVSKPGEMEPGVTLFNPRRRRVGRGQAVAEFNAAFGMLAALDSGGEVVWYYKVDSRISDFEKLSNGNLIFVTADFRLIEIDWLGNTLNQWYATGRPQGPTDGIAVDTLTFHHEIDEMPSGNILVLSAEAREIDDYYTSEYDEYSPPHLVCYA